MFQPQLRQILPQSGVGDSPCSWKIPLELYDITHVVMATFVCDITEEFKNKMLGGKTHSLKYVLFSLSFYSWIFCVKSVQVYDI